MSLDQYFSELIKKVESSNEISNAGTDENGFYKPVRTVVIRNLNLLKDLHAKPLAKAMVKSAWASVTKVLPPEWLEMSEADRLEFKKILES